MEMPFIPVRQRGIFSSPVYRYDTLPERAPKILFLALTLTGAKKFNGCRRSERNRGSFDQEQTPWL